MSILTDFINPITIPNLSLPQEYLLYFGNNVSAT